MAKRDPDADVQLHFRVREHLRARLEAEAKRRAVTLSAEIARRLEASFTLPEDLATVHEALQVSEQHRAEAQAQAYRLTNVLLEQWPQIRARPPAKEQDK